MYYKLYLQNSLNTICPRNIACFKCVIINNLKKGIYNNNNNNNNNRYKNYTLYRNSR
jgi:hypothetical protein